MVFLNILIWKPVLPSFKSLEKACIDSLNVFSREKVNNLTIEGELSKVQHFLYDLQNAPFLFNVGKLHLEKDPLKENFLRCALTLNKRLLRNND